MPKYDDDGRAPRRDQLRAAQREDVKHRSRKNTRLWCRGKIGVKHETEIRLGKYNAYHDVDGVVCYRADWWPKRWAKHWSCAHEEYCVNCGKIIRYTLDKDCPIYEPEKITRFRELERARIKQLRERR